MTYFIWIQFHKNTYFITILMKNNGAWCRAVDLTVFLSQIKSVKSSQDQINKQIKSFKSIIQIHKSEANKGYIQVIIKF